MQRITDDGTLLEMKKSKGIPSDYLQNPSDPDVTDSSHKGQGYPGSGDGDLL